MSRFVKWVIAGMCGLLVSCAIITVNVYFPEKDVKQAYKSLDEMLLKGDQPNSDGEPTGNGEKKQEIGPESRLFERQFHFSLVSEASAQEPLADELAVELSSMPEVLKAYDDLRARLPLLNTLRESGAVGENKQGLLSVRDQSKLAGNEEVVKTVNNSRKAVITGMAKAILKINKQPVTDKGIQQVLPKAAAAFADIRREEAKPGWWIELANGKWVQK